MYKMVHRDDGSFWIPLSYDELLAVECAIRHDINQNSEQHNGDRYWVGINNHDIDWEFANLLAPTMVSPLSEHVPGRGILYDMSNVEIKGDVAELRMHRYFGPLCGKTMQFKLSRDCGWKVDEARVTGRS